MVARHSAAVPVKSLQCIPPEHFERLIENSPDIVIGVDRVGTVIYYNDGAERNLGYSAAEIIGRPVEILYPTPAEPHRVMAAMRDDDWGGPGKVKSFETTFVDRWGGQFPVAISGAILYDDNGLETGSIGFAKDIREIRKRDRLATLGEVAVALCHEINSPLEVVFNEVELLHGFLRETCSEEGMVAGEKRLDAIRREARGIRAIVDRLAEMARKGEYGTREYLHGQEMVDMGTTEIAEAEPRAGERTLAGLRVLVVDDDLGVCRSLRDLLVAEGCVVHTADDGLKALELFERLSIDIVVSDVVMPDLDGYDLFMEIRKRGDTPVILMTGYYYDRDHVIKRSRLEGLESVIFKKPIDPERLKATIRRRCGLEEAGAGSAPPASV